MELARAFGIAVGAAQSGIRIDTDEVDDALATMERVCNEEGHIFCRYTDVDGLTAAEGVLYAPEKRPVLLPLRPVPAGMRDTLPDTLDRLTEYADRASKGVDNPRPIVLAVPFLSLMIDANPLARPILIQKVFKFLGSAKANGLRLAILTPAGARLPAELVPLFHVIAHELPGEAELVEALRGVDEGVDQGRYTQDEIRTLAKAALGMTRLQAEGAFATGMQVWDEAVEKIDPAEVWKVKAEILNRDKFVEMKESTLSFKDVGGLDGFKTFLKRLVAHDPLADVNPKARYKGVVVVGPPGVGKSLMAYCAGNEFGMPTLLANPGNLMGQYVGETETNTRKFFQLVRRMAPCVVVIDEVSQAMPTGKDGGGDSGVSRRLLGAFLTAMNDIQEPIFWFFTSNGVEDMHEAFLRAGRVDAKVYVGLPDTAQRAAVWRIYVGTYFPAEVAGEPDPRYVPLGPKGVVKAWKNAGHPEDDEWASKLAASWMAQEPGERVNVLAAVEKVSADFRAAVEEAVVDDAGWTPAEIEACCRLARLLGVSLKEAADCVGHVCTGVKGAKRIARLEAWAEDEGALDAETGVLFVRPEAPAEERAVTPRSQDARRKVRARRKEKVE